jgi:heptosyltransferase-2
MIKNILIIKHGALGDVVRTAYFAKALNDKHACNSDYARIYWLTTHGAAPLLRFNPYVDCVVTDYQSLKDVQFDIIYSLDDEEHYLKIVSLLTSSTIIGVYLDSDGYIKYCDRSRYWFDMGLVSRHGIEKANKIKKQNNKTHAEIFKQIFDVDTVDISFYNSSIIESNMARVISKLSENKIPIGINAYAGARWASKSLSDTEYDYLLRELCQYKINDTKVHIYLLGSGKDYDKNLSIASRHSCCSNITVLETSHNVLELAAVIRHLKYIITSDSLCLHLSISQSVPTVAFFSPTSADEIENVDYIRKIRSTSNEYCNYKSESDNTSITSARITRSFTDLLKSRNHG